MTGRRLPLIALLLVLGGLLAPLPARAELPADILDSYTIAVSPQPDGMLVMEYTLTDYHAMSDWPSDQPYLQIGVPNANFEILESDATNAQIARVEKVDSHGSFVQFDFDRLPRNGDVFDLHFKIRQGKMAYSDTGHNQITYKFIPAGWTFPISVARLSVTWPNPADRSLLRSVKPDPMQSDDVILWRWDMPSISSGMFGDSTIELAYDASAFTLSDAAKGDGGDTSGFGLFLIVAAGVIVALGGVFVFGSISRDGYGTGSGFSARRWRGGGGFGGHVGHSCACAGCACACACACAGGGKVGCSRKAIGIACLPRALDAMAKGDSRTGHEVSTPAGSQPG